MLPQKLAFVDVETTGTHAQYDRVIEVGIIRVENGNVTDTFSSLVNPDTHIPPHISSITGISSEDVSNAPSFREISGDITKILEDCVLVAHNVRFDYSFLRHEFARMQKRFTKRHFCTVRLSRLLFPSLRKHNLDSLIERFNIPCKNRHRALDDASVLVTFFDSLKKTIPEEKLIKAVTTSMKQPSLPKHLEKHDVSSLPESPGVYVFYAENNMPLYIGKSINIKDRVLSHFASDVHVGREMKIAQQIQRIETHTTAGELGALFLESQLIKKHLPLYNRRLRYTRELIVLKEETDSDGYKTVSLSHLPTLSEVDIDNLSSILGIFRSKKEAKQFLTSLVKEFQLCDKLLGLEKPKKECFSARLRICKGACIKDEKPLFYNLRFTTAFSKNKLLPWPFKGPIIIEEHNTLEGVTEAFVFHKWCYLGQMRKNEDSHAIADMQSMQFDLDTYKILNRFLKDERNGVKIRVISQNDIKTVFDETQIPLI